MALRIKVCFFVNFLKIIVYVKCMVNRITNGFTGRKCASSIMESVKELIKPFTKKWIGGV